MTFSFLKNPHLDLLWEKIETERCMIVPFSVDGILDMHEVQREFCKANKNLFINPFLPTYEEEYEFIKNIAEGMKTGQSFENFIIEKWTHRLIGAVGLNSPEEETMNIGLWIRENEHGKWYATEAYDALIDWARKNVRYKYLKHSTNPENIASVKLALKFLGILQEEKTYRGHDIYHILLSL